MAIGITPGRERRYVLRADRKLPEDEQTVFRFRTLTASERAELEDDSAFVREGVYRTTLNRNDVRTVEACLLGWSNFRDENGDAIPFHVEEKPRELLGTTRCYPSKATLDRLTLEQIIELANEIRSAQRLTEDDAKNSSSPPSSFSAEAADSGHASSVEIQT